MDTLGELGYEIAHGLETLFKGVLDRQRLLDYVLSFITFEHDGGESESIAKKAAAYHQYHAVNKAVAYSLSACGIEAPANLRFGRFTEVEVIGDGTLKVIARALVETAFPWTGPNARMPGRRFV